MTAVAFDFFDALGVIPNNVREPATVLVCFLLRFLLRYERNCRGAKSSTSLLEIFHHFYGSKKGKKDDFRFLILPRRNQLKFSNKDDSFLTSFI